MDTVTMHQPEESLWQCLIYCYCSYPMATSSHSKYLLFSLTTFTSYSHIFCASLCNSLAFNQNVNAKVVLWRWSTQQYEVRCKCKKRLNYNDLSKSNWNQIINKNWQTKCRMQLNRTVKMSYKHTDVTCSSISIFCLDVALCTVLFTNHFLHKASNIISSIPNKWAICAIRPSRV